MNKNCFLLKAGADISLLFLMAITAMVGCSEESNVAPQPALLLSERQLFLNFEEEAASLTLFNTGNVDIHWEIPPVDELTTITPYRGTLSPGDSVVVIISVYRQFLASGEYTEPIVVKTQEEIEAYVDLTIFHFVEEKWLLHHRIVDAEYDKDNNRIVSVEQKDNTLLLINPISKTTETVALTATPTCVSVQPGGNYAAVGHRGFISVVDLRNKKVEKEIGLTFGVFDLVLAPNHWLYVFPEEGQHVDIRCVDLNTGIQTASLGYSIYERTKAKLHPSGNYIYGANTQTIPSDIEKYDIRNDTAIYQYDSPYHGDYGFGGDLWLIKGGAQIIAKSGNVFQTSENSREDMLYLNSLEVSAPIKTLDVAERQEKIYAVEERSGYSDYKSSGSSFIQVLHATTFQLEKTITLPPFLIEDAAGKRLITEADGEFGFFDSVGTYYYALVKAGSGSQERWAVVTIPIQ